MVGVAYVTGLVVACVLTLALAAGKPSHQAVQTIYVQNLAPQYISDATIKRDIPAWEKAVNDDFAPIWHSTQYRIVMGVAPKGAISATFVDKGPVQGALAYHTVSRGAPAIVIYAGTADYYHFDNSVSFTHELFELAADPTISITNQGWPYDWVYTVSKNFLSTHRYSQQEGTIWANEVCDPVEAYSYLIDGVKISDFITPNWFNDEVSGGYDFMQLVQQPFTVLWGGYAQFFNGRWNIVQNFRHAGPDAAGFLKGDPR